LPQDVAAFIGERVGPHDAPTDDCNLPAALGIRAVAHEPTRCQA
jgi:hypothetical protein